MSLFRSGGGRQEPPELCSQGGLMLLLKIESCLLAHCTDEAVEA